MCMCAGERSNSTKKELLEATLQTLLRFMSWIPLGYIFQTQLVELLVMKFFASPAFRCDALHCLNEIACLETSGVPAHDRVLEQLFVGAMNVLVTHIPPGADIRRGFTAGREEEKLLIQRLSLFFTNFFKVRGRSRCWSARHARRVGIRHGGVTRTHYLASCRLAHPQHHLTKLEAPQFHPALVAGMTYLVKISDVDEPEIFKICLEYWHHLAHDLYKTECQGAASKDVRVPARVVPAQWRPTRNLRADA